jgi:hypothetical protein
MIFFFAAILKKQIIFNSGLDLKDNELSLLLKTRGRRKKKKVIQQSILSQNISNSADTSGDVQLFLNNLNISLNVSTSQNKSDKKKIKLKKMKTKGEEKTTEIKMTKEVDVNPRNVIKIFLQSLIQTVFIVLRQCLCHFATSGFPNSIRNIFIGL